MPITKCKKCGSKDFILDEGFAWKCEVDEDGNLNCYKPYTEINSIVCNDCSNDAYIDDFNQINFN